MLACSVEELEVDKCRRAGWRSGTSFRGASSFRAESLSQSTILPRLATKLSLFCRDQICFRNCLAARLPERGGARRPRLPRDDFRFPDSERARKGRRTAQALMERNNSNKPPTFLGDNDVRRTASPTIMHIALRLHLSEHATTQQWPPFYQDFWSGVEYSCRDEYGL